MSCQIDEKSDEILFNLDPWVHLVSDKESEKKFGFNLSKTLKGKRNLLEGKSVFATKSVQPAQKEMKGNYFITQHYHMYH